MKPEVPRMMVLTLGAAGLTMSLVLGCVAADAGPLAPLSLAKTGDRAFRPELLVEPGIAELRVYRVGPKVAGRLQRIDVQVGQRVRAGEVLGQVDAGGMSVQLVSPADGVVTSRDVAPGAMVPGGQTVVRILRTGSEWVRVGMRV